jgi:hypothetical protein
MEKKTTKKITTITTFSLDQNDIRRAIAAYLSMQGNQLEFNWHYGDGFAEDEISVSIIHEATKTE